MFLWQSFSLQHWGESSCLPPTNCLRKGNRISHRQEKRALEAVCNTNCLKNSFPAINHNLSIALKWLRARSWLKSDKKHYIEMSKKKKKIHVLVGMCYKSLELQSSYLLKDFNCIPPSKRYLLCLSQLCKAVNLAKEIWSLSVHCLERGKLRVKSGRNEWPCPSELAFAAFLSWHNMKTHIIFWGKKPKTH